MTTFEPDTKREILEAMLAVYEDSFNRELSTNEVAVLVQFADPIAGYFENQQQDLDGVLRALDIDEAIGESLDNLGQLVGVFRRGARPASVRLQFQSNDPVTRTYTVPSNARAQTDSSNPVTFATDSPLRLHYLDGFEDDDIVEYSGDTGSFQTQSSTVETGSYALESTGSGGILNLNYSIADASRYHIQIYPSTGAQPAFLYGATNLSNYYEARVDQQNSEIAVDVVDGGTRTNLGSTAASVPAGEFLHLQVSWGADASHSLTLFDSTGAEVATLNTSEAEATFEEGSYGVRESAGQTAYFDELTMSRASVPATATEAGGRTNVGANTVTVLTQSYNGINDVTNPLESDGGRDREGDSAYRARIQDELSDGAASTLPAVLSSLDQIDETKTVSVIVNDTNSTDAEGRPGHSFEPVVDVNSDFYSDVAEAIVETKAVGDTSVGGYAGTSVTRTVELSNGQTKDVTFSVPAAVQIYVDCTLESTDNYAGDDAVRDAVVQYIGGTLTGGDNVDGRLGVGDDVIYNTVIDAIMSVPGVYDITDLQVDTSSSPSGESNISIANTENATADGEDASLAITSNDV